MYLLSSEICHKMDPVVLRELYGCQGAYVALIHEIIPLEVMLTATRILKNFKRYNIETIPVLYPGPKGGGLSEVPF